MIAVRTATSSNVLSNRHKMLDFEDLCLDDGERLACAPKSAVPGEACRELG